MLTELIDKIDCNPELMMTLAEQLGTLTNHLGQNEEEKAKDKKVEAEEKLGGLASTFSS